MNLVKIVYSQVAEKDHYTQHNNLKYNQIYLKMYS